LSARRLSRCHPFGGFGFDPVPQHDTLTHDTAVSGRA
jgi:putative component of membrane protein insertase Oxa1/YidC/SpoIIIJ protein YidD